MITGIVLAAGSGTRLGSPKAELIVDGERLVDRALGVLRAGGCEELIAVVRVGVRADAVLVENPDPARGMGSSMRLGLAAATGDRAVIMLVDTPGISATAVAAVAAAGPVAIATYAGRRGHPAAFDRAWWDEVSALADGDHGARPFLQAHPELVDEVPCVGDPADIDTVADLAAAVSSLSVSRSRAGRPGPP